MPTFDEFGAAVVAPANTTADASAAAAAAAAYYGNAYPYAMPMVRLRGGVCLSSRAHNITRARAATADGGDVRLCTASVCRRRTRHRRADAPE